LEVVLTHETADLLGIDDYAAMAQLGANPAIAIGFELITDRDHGRDQHEDQKFVSPMRCEKYGGRAHLIRRGRMPSNEIVRKSGPLNAASADVKCGT
jgi:hypothetical protein